MFRGVFEVDREVGWVVWSGTVVRHCFFRDAEVSPAGIKVQTVLESSFTFLTHVQTPWGSWTGKRRAAAVSTQPPQTQGLCLSPGGISGGAFIVGALYSLFKTFTGPWHCITGNSIGAIATAFLAQEPPGDEMMGLYKMAKSIVSAPQSILQEREPPVMNGGSFATAQYLQQQLNFNAMVAWDRDASWGSTAVTEIGLVDRPLQCYRIFRPSMFTSRSSYDAALSIVASTTICSVQYSPFLMNEEFIDGGYLDMLPLRNFEYLPDRIVTVAAHAKKSLSLPAVGALWERSWTRYRRQIAFLQQRANVQVVTVRAVQPYATTPDPLDRSLQNILKSVLVGRQSALDAAVPYTVDLTGSGLD